MSKIVIQEQMNCSTGQELRLSGQDFFRNLVATLFTNGKQVLVISLVLVINNISHALLAMPVPTF
jgi:hypothetical protein